MKSVKFESFDKTKLQCYLWDEARSPKGVVQIVHGMAEHARRYDDFANFLNKNGYIVFADDHRAHGNTVKKDSLGYHEGQIFEDSVKDELAITDYLKNKYNLPIVLVGHSYGSFLSQRYMQEGSVPAGVILSGSANMDGGVIKMGGMVANMQHKLYGGEKQAKLLDKMAFGSYDKNFKKEKVKFAWLSSDLEVGKKYFFDEQCGYVMSIGFYKYFFAGLQNAYKSENLAKIKKDQKIAIFSGDKDPVGGKDAALVKKLYEMYKGLGLNPSMKLYEDARHEILNEKNKREVYQDFLNAINGFIG